MQDALLLRRYVREHSQAAFSEIVQHYRRLVYVTCLRETENAQVAEDAAQSVFLLLARKAPSLTGRASLAGWLFQTARLTAKEALRRQRRQQRREQSATLPPDTALSQHAFREALNQTLGSLKAAEREAILLRFFEEMSFQEIGAVLRVSEDTAQKRVSRALDKMRAQMTRQEQPLTIALLSDLLLTHSRIEPPPSPGLTNRVFQNTTNIAQGVLQTMWMTNAKLAAGVLSLALTGAGIGIVVLKTVAAPTSPTAEQSLSKADWAKPLTIQAIRITGNHQISTAEILRHVQSKPGETLNGRTLGGDTGTIYQLGGFDLVGPWTVSTTGNGNVIVTIPVTETLKSIPAIASPLYFEDIRISGNYRVPTAEILKHVAVKPGDVAGSTRRLKMDQAVASIQAMGQFASVGPYTVKQIGNRVIVTIPVKEK